jgi:hypothetical protein
MKKTLTLTILALTILAQTSIARADSVSFTLSVTLPPMVQMIDNSLASTQGAETYSDNQPFLAKNKPSQMIQEQLMIRGHEEVRVRSVVVI